MTEQHLKPLNRWRELFKDIGLDFIEEKADQYTVRYRGRAYAPYKMKLDLTRNYGHVESSGDFETNYGGRTVYGTMWDEDSSEHVHGSMPFDEWVLHYLNRMAKIVRGEVGPRRLMFVSGS